MKAPNLLQNESGLSLIEVLIGSLVFMVGFSILIAFLSTATTKIAPDDLVAAMSLAEEELQEAQASSPTIETTEKERLFHGKRFLVTKTIQMVDSLVSVRVEVKRLNQRRTLADVYCEFKTLEK